MKTRNELTEELINKYVQVLRTNLSDEKDLRRHQCVQDSISRAEQDIRDIPRLNPEQLEDMFKDYMGAHSELFVEKIRAQPRNKARMKPPKAF
ncbi:MAG: hypothetical protein PSY14_03645 [bacterium]|nr:hypothetical protein [bacterium]